MSFAETANRLFKNGGREYQAVNNYSYGEVAEEGVRWAKALLAYNKGAPWREALGEELYKEWADQIDTMTSIVAQHFPGAMVTGEFLWDTVRGLRPGPMEIVCNDGGDWSKLAEDVFEAFPRCNEIWDYDDMYQIVIGGPCEVTLQFISNFRPAHFGPEYLSVPIRGDVFNVETYLCHKSALRAVSVIDQLRKGGFQYVCLDGLCRVSSPEIEESRKYLVKYGLREVHYGTHELSCAANRVRVPFIDQIISDIPKNSFFPLCPGTTHDNTFGDISTVLKWVVERTSRVYWFTRSSLMKIAGQLLKEMYALKKTSTAEFDGKEYDGDYVNEALGDVRRKYVFTDIGTGYGETHFEAWQRVVRGLEDIASEYDAIVSRQNSY